MSSGAGQPTSNLHDVTRHDVSGLDPLHSFPVLPVHFPHLGLVLLKCLDGILSIAFLVRRKTDSAPKMSELPRDDLITSQKLTHRAFPFEQALSWCLFYQVLVGDIEMLSI